MVNTTSDYWSVDGVSLHTLAWNISTLAGRMAPPPLRGTDIVIPYAIGERWVEKIPGSRIMPLAMWIKGSDENGGVPEGRTARMQFDDNWRALQNLLWTPGRQFNLTKRFYVDGVLRVATAKAEFASGMEPTMIGRNGAKFVVNLKLADPYFYDDDVTSILLVPGATHQNFEVPGQARTFNIEIEVDGPSNALEFINWTTESVVKLTKTVSSTEKITIDVRNWFAWLQPDGGGTYDVAGFVEKTDTNPMWWSLDAGVNDLQTLETPAVAGGNITLRVRGAWL